MLFLRFKPALVRMLICFIIEAASSTIVAGIRIQPDFDMVDVRRAFGDDVFNICVA
jgi:hypothetical protein